MSVFAQRVGAIAGVAEEQMQRLSGGDLSEVLLIRRGNGHCSVAKGGPSVAAEASMLRALHSAGIAVPLVEAEYDTVLLLEHVAHDGMFTPAAWRDLGHIVRRLHRATGDSYGWPVDYRFGSVEIDNRPTADWRRFWVERRLVATAGMLDRPWRERVDRAAAVAQDLLPAEPVASLLHGDLWPGNILVANGKVAALIDPACYYGHAEVDLAMLDLFGSPPRDFEQAYGMLDPGWEERRCVYQLFPALVHLRLFGTGYAAMADRLLTRLGS